MLHLSVTISFETLRPLFLFKKCRKIGFKNIQALLYLCPDVLMFPSWSKATPFEFHWSHKFLENFICHYFFFSLQYQLLDLWSFLQRCLSVENLKVYHTFSKSKRVIPRTTEPILGLLVLIWRHFYAPFKNANENLNFENFWEKF